MSEQQPLNRSRDASSINQAAATSCPVGCRIAPQDLDTRADSSETLRKERAEIMRRQGVPKQLCNRDEEKYQQEGSEFKNRFIASYTKGFKHNSYGEIEDPAHYCALLRALVSGEPSDFESLTLGCSSGSSSGDSEGSKRFNIQAELATTNSRQIKQVNPQAALAFDLQGIDSHQAEIFDWGRRQGSQVARIAFPPAPRFEDAEEIAEIAENYWMALLRDVNFTQYEKSNPTLPTGVTVTPQQAADSLTEFVKFNFKGPLEGARVTTHALFRGITKGDLIGPYISQFLLHPIPYGAQRIDSRIKTVAPEDYMTRFSDWLEVQNGCKPSNGNDCGTGEFLYIRNGRDLGQYVHVDLPYQAYYNACLLLLGVSGEGALSDCAVNGGFGAKVDDENIYKESKTQQGFVTLGPANIKVLLAEVTTRALKAMWYQKWVVHRRFRPEAFGGRIHVHKRSTGSKKYLFHPDAFALLESNVLPEIVKHNRRFNGPDEEDSYLLPMAFAEGSPLHPAYGAGHAVIAGACVTILKAWFRGENTFEELKIRPKVASEDGKLLIDYPGSDDDAKKMTINSELDKLASNISIGRDFAGVHWRSDYTWSLRLGEAIAVWLLCDQRRTFNEDFKLTLTTFDNYIITISKNDIDCF